MWPINSWTRCATRSTARGVARPAIHSELFGALPAINPASSAPHPHPAAPASGRWVRPRLVRPQRPDRQLVAGFRTILDLAEVVRRADPFLLPQRCMSCVRTGVVEGSVNYVSRRWTARTGPVLICSAAPASDLALDL